MGALVLAAAVLTTTVDAAAQLRAGSANNAAPAGGGSSSSYQQTQQQLQNLENQLPACQRRCGENAATCISRRARRGNENQVATQCKNEEEACMNACGASSNGAATMPNFGSSFGGGDADGSGATRPDYDAIAQMNDATEAQRAQLEQAWTQADQQRVAQTEQVAQQAIRETLGPLCANGTIQQGTCTAIQQALQLPTLQNATNAYDRFRALFQQKTGVRLPNLPPLSAAPRSTKGLLWPLSGAASDGGIYMPAGQVPCVQSGTYGNGQTCGNTPPFAGGIPQDRVHQTPSHQLTAAQQAQKKGKEGCYVTTDWVGKGQMWAMSSGPTPEITAQFVGNGYLLHNTGTHDAYAGYPVPYDMLIPAGGDLLVYKGTYVDRQREQRDPHAFELEVGVKYWTDDDDLCKTGGVHPGFTTPEEWGPSTQDDAAPPSAPGDLQ